MTVLILLPEEGAPWIESGPVLMPGNDAVILARSVLKAAETYNAHVTPQPDTAPDVGPSTEGADDKGPSGPD